jgi:hypothetical protein
MWTGNGSNNILVGTQSQIVNPTDFAGLATSEALLDKILKSDWRLLAGSSLINAGVFDAGVTAWSLYRIERTDGVPDIGAAEYFNPANDIRTVKSDGNKAKVWIEDGRLIFGEQAQSVKLIDVSGKIVSTGQYTQSLSLAGLPKGIYICLLEVNGNHYSAKILK